MLQTKPIFSLRKQKPKTRLSLSLWSPKPSENHQPLLKPPALIPLTPLTEPIGNSCGLTGYSRCVETTKRTGSSRLGDPLSKRLVIVTRGGLRDYVAACGPPDREKRWVTKTTSLCFLFFLWVINLVGSPGKNIWLPYIWGNFWSSHMKIEQMVFGYQETRYQMVLTIYMILLLSFFQMG